MGVSTKIRGSQRSGEDWCKSLVTLKDIYWLAGLLEGEGSFLVRKQNGRLNAFRIQMKIGDKDVAEMAAKIMRVKVNGPYKTRTPKGKPGKLTWEVRTNVKPHSIGWMLTLFSLMGERRKAQISKAIDMWIKEPIPLTGKYRRGALRKYSEVVGAEKEDKNPWIPTS